MRIYTCWQEATCYVCASTCGGPRFHASSKGWNGISPCSTTGTKIVAGSREEALRIYKAKWNKRESLS